MENVGEFYRAEEIAELLKVNVMTIYRYIRAGKLKANKIGKEFRVSKVDFNQFLIATSTHK